MELKRLELDRWQRRYIDRVIRKRHRFSFKQKTNFWGLVCILFSLSILITYFVESLRQFAGLTCFFMLISLALCSSNGLADIIKKYDDLLNKERRFNKK